MRTAMVAARFASTAMADETRFFFIFMFLFSDLFQWGELTYNWFLLGQRSIAGPWAEQNTR